MTCQFPFCVVEQKKQKLSEINGGLEDADTLVQLNLSLPPTPNV
jgi:hypothetical protein